MRRPTAAEKTSTKTIAKTKDAGANIEKDNILHQWAYTKMKIQINFPLCTN